MGVKIFVPLEANARLSFEELGEPSRYQNDPKNKARWAATFLVPYGNDFVKFMEEKLEQVAKEAFGKGWKAIYDEVLLDKKGCCWIDGKRKQYNGYEGHWALTAYRDEKDGRPLVLDNDGSPIFDAKNQLNPGKAGRLFGGCFVRGEVEIWAQDNKQGKGLRAGLLQVQRVKKGDAFGGASAPVAGSLGALADDDEDELVDEDLG
jgi:hypothetical protein